jgi:hypothetical protein
MTQEKNRAELEIEALQDVFAIATTGFKDFYKESEKSKAASAGDSSRAASSGYRSRAASAGGYSWAASAGDYSRAASAGGYSRAASAGDYSTAASAGDYSTAASAGSASACAALGYRAAVSGDKGNLIIASEYILEGDNFIPIGGRADIIDGKKLKPKRWYIVEGGEWVEVDFTDNIFSRVISVKSGVKKVRTEDGKILFIVSDDKGNSAHGETIAEARNDLIYKAVTKFEGEVPEQATGKEWVGIYRSITGACAVGVKMFVEKTGKSLNETYTAQEICDLVVGQYGGQEFSKKVRGGRHEHT